MRVSRVVPLRRLRSSRPPSDRRRRNRRARPSNGSGSRRRRIPSRAATTLVAVQHIAPADFDPGARAGRRACRGIPGEAHDVMARFDQLGDEASPDISGCSSDGDLHTGEATKATFVPIPQPRRARYGHKTLGGPWPTRRRWAHDRFTRLPAPSREHRSRRPACSHPTNDLPKLDVASPPEFGGPAGTWSPEHLFVAAISSCLMTTFRAIASMSNLDVVDYKDDATGHLVREESSSESSRSRFVRRSSSPIPTRSTRHWRLLEKAERACLISRSVSAEIGLKERSRSRHSAEARSRREGPPMLNRGPSSCRSGVTER
jgi:organic hydroperoxide reductase OsmC/OhrA